jgi:uncharacterized protein YdhG (YjbR/CyaY superfamily)
MPAGDERVSLRAMVSSSAQTVKEYLSELPPDRRAAVQSVRKVIMKNLPRGFEEGMGFGMIGYYVPLSRYPDTYNGHPLSIAGLASQKGHLSLYLMGVYADPAQRKWFEAEYAKSGKKMDMGKACLRFKSADELPLDLIGKVIAKTSVDEFIAYVESAHGAPKKKAAKKKVAKKVASKKR